MCNLITSNKLVTIQDLYYRGRSYRYTNDFGTLDLIEVSKTSLILTTIELRIIGGCERIFVNIMLPTQQMIK